MLDKTTTTHPKKQKSAILTRYPSNLFKFRRNETFGEGGVNDWLLKCLPYEILLYVFTLLHRTDLVNASRVCKHFRTVSKDPLFGWTTCFKSTLYIWNSQNNVPDDPKLDYSKFDLRYMKTDPIYHYYSWALCEQEKSVFLVTHHITFPKMSHAAAVKYERETREYLEKAVTEFIGLCKSHPNMFRFFVKYAGKDFSHDTVALTVQICIHSMELLVQQGDPVPALPRIIEWVKQQSEQTANQRVEFFVGNKSVKCPLKSNYATKQPSGLKEGIKLYKYQLDAVRWMKSVEADIAAKIPFKYVTLMPWRAASSEVLFDLRKGLALPSNKLAEHISSFYPKGGVLADEMGLGKTIEVLGLVLSNPPTVEEEAEMNARNTENMDNEDDFEKLQFKTRATLVACPNHLAQQWQEELIKFSDPPWKVLKFTTIPELKNSSYEEITQADVVLVAVQLLKYASYQNIGKATKKAAATKQKVNSKDREKRVESLLKKVRRSIAKGEEHDDPPLLEHFQWHRLVIDEAHEVVADYEYQDIFSMFKAKYYWYVSGTPIPSENVLLGILEFLEFPWDSSANYMKHTFADIFWNNLYWRNTKESVKDEYTIPDVIEDLVLLDFTDVENVLYKEFTDDKKQLCSKMPQIGSCKTLSDIKEFKINERKQKIKSLRTTIFSLKQEQEEHSQQIEKLYKELAEIDERTQQGRNIQQTIHKIDFRTNCEIPQELEKNEKEMQVQTDSMLLYEATKSFKEKMNNIKKLTRALSSPLKSLLKSSSNNNNNNNDDMEVAAKELPSEEEIPHLNVTQLREIITSHNVTPKSNKTEMQKQLKHLIGFIKDERIKTQQEKSNKKRKQEDAKPTETPVKKQKTENENEEESQVSDTRVESAIELLDLVERLGTKMGNLIFYLKKLWRTTPESRVIIFSQFDAVLFQVDDVLSQCDIKSVSVKGNVNQKNEALNSFKDADSEVKVILLSLAKAASGSNLIQASHVVLIDPISGTKEEVQAVEAQAIGRAYRQGQSQHVTVVRLLIKETDEHAMYLKIYIQEGEQFQDGTLQCSNL